MNIDSIEVRNYRKLKSTRIDFNDETTLFVGANNSGKTSAMAALRMFLIEPKTIALRDITIGNWRAIDQIGTALRSGLASDDQWKEVLPSLDVWLDVPLTQIHKVVRILPTIDWAGGALGVRLQYEIADLDGLKAAFVEACDRAKAIADAVPSDAPQAVVKPTCLTEFLENDFARHVVLRAYALDPDVREVCDGEGVQQPQVLPDGAIVLPGYPFESLIKISEISAQRDFADEGPATDGEASRSGRFKRRLSDQVRSYFDTHIDQATELTADDAAAVGALQHAEKTFDVRLRSGFQSALKELEGLGYPGLDNPSITFNTQLEGTEGLKHGSAIQYRVTRAADEDDVDRHLPETFAGLGYQNLISMVFMLMRFRDDWLAETHGDANSDDQTKPLHLVLVEEPEAHLHAQVQQVFINKAFNLLRNHVRLKDPISLSTQLIVSTHSSHVAHEVDFAALRYFRRHEASSSGQSATTTVANLSHTFGDGDGTAKFVKRYLKATHCDLFFADAAIFVEGQAERLLVPQFIRNDYPRLWGRYTSLIDIGGAHAHRFEQLVRELGLTVLVISDLDAAEPTEVPNSSGGVTKRNLKARPRPGIGQVTTNVVLKKWHPKLSLIDELLKVPAEKHATRVNDEYEIYVAYQKAVADPGAAENDSKSAMVIPRTFEDALIYANYNILSEMTGSSTSNKIRKIILSGDSGEKLEESLFDLMDSAEKAAFALDCLFQIEDPKALVPPPYIAAGLDWLDETLARDVEDLAAMTGVGND